MDTERTEVWPRGGGTKFSITKIRHHQTNLHTNRLVCNGFNLMYPNYGYKAHRNVAEQTTNMLT